MNEAAAYEPESVSAPPPRRDLRLLCLLVRRVPVEPASCQSTPCDQCRPASVFKVDGIWRAKPAFTCAKHKPPRRPPKYWNVIHDSGKPTPFVPIREPFELEG
uniref:lysogeny maintenance protein PflM n=1 Tax=Pseudomonas paralcaligenes TaxID=2772558 RepID=UPI0027E42FD6|nr:DUF5447 family protein [Pseudomonas paralcaligenes]